ncbi:hypothetical protein [Aliiroseovarius crassostreae]|nr:hypothetical protein [Aliiroseovarius crassostreae]
MKTLIQSCCGAMSSARLWPKIFSVVLVFGLCPIEAFAETKLQPLTSKPERKATTFSVLDVSPGDMAFEAIEALLAHFDQQLVDELVTLNVRSSKGREFRYEYAQRMLSPWVTPFMRMGQEPYEEVILSLATGVLEGRVLGVQRTIVAVGNDRPSAETVFAQVKETFGPPSYEKFDSFESHLLYLISSDGFISNLRDLDTQIVAQSGQGNLRSSTGMAGGQFDNETPCVTAIGQANLPH